MEKKKGVSPKVFVEKHNFTKRVQEVCGHYSSLPLLSTLLSVESFLYSLSRAFCMFCIQLWCSLSKIFSVASTSLLKLSGCCFSDSGRAVHHCFTSSRFAA